jgi:hypothetical protein
MDHKLTRRQFLFATGAAASVSLINSPVSLFDRAEAAQPMVRRDVGGDECQRSHPRVLPDCH